LICALLFAISPDISLLTNHMAVVQELKIVDILTVTGTLFRLGLVFVLIPNRGDLGTWLKRAHLRIA